MFYSQQNPLANNEENVVSFRVDILYLKLILNLYEILIFPLNQFFFTILFLIIYKWNFFLPVHFWCCLLSQDSVFGAVY